tara:strand:+ start:112 stop:312 length:201 start_codon:yes stop_codon:yes gene_type:complete
MKEQVDRIRKVLDIMYDNLNIDLYKINNGKVSTVDVNENNRVVPFDLVKDNVRDIINQLRKLEELY